MPEYKISVNATQIKRAALHIVRDETSLTWLVKLIDTAFENVIRQEDAFDHIRRMLSRHGYNLSPIELINTPQRRVLPVLDEDDSDAPKSKVRTTGQIIRSLRRKNNWTQAELAAKLNWGQSTLSEFEHDRKMPTNLGLSQLAKVFGTSIAALADVTVKKRKSKKTAYTARDRQNEDSDLPMSMTPAHKMNREQIVGELKALFVANPWLTKKELINNYEFGEDDYEYIMANEPMMIPAAVLVDYLKDVRGGLVERAVEVAAGVKHTVKNPGPKLTRTLKAFEITHSAMSAFEMHKVEYEQIMASHYREVTDGQLNNWLHAVRGFVLQPATKPKEYVRERLLIDVLWYEDLFNVTPEVYLEAGVSATQQVWIDEREATKFSGQELFKVREDLKALLLKAYKEDE